MQAARPDSKVHVLVRMSASQVISALVVTLVAARAQGASAVNDDTAEGEQAILIPTECLQFRAAAENGADEALWDAMLSFAACVQDASIYSVDSVEMLPVLVDKLEEAGTPSFQFSVGVLEHAPEHVKVRAAYALALGEVALMTRARMSLETPELRGQLEQLLDTHAQLAYVIFSAIDEVAQEAPETATDPVNQAIVRSSRQLAAALRTRWPETVAQELTFSGGRRAPSSARAAPPSRPPIRAASA